MAKKKEDKPKIVKKSNILLLKVYSSDEYFTDSPYAVMKITPEVLKDVRIKKAIIDMASWKDKEKSFSELYKMTYWSPDWCATFLHERDMPDDFEDELNTEVQYLSKLIEAGDELRVDIHLMHIYSDSIRFECGIKNTNIKLETAMISFEELGL